MVVFRPFSDLVAPRHYIFIIKLNLILNDSVTRKMWPFTNMKYSPSCSFLWWSSSRLVRGTRGTFCTCCGIFQTIFRFRMDTIGPYMDSSLLMSSMATLLLMIWFLERMFIYSCTEGQPIFPCRSWDLSAHPISRQLKYYL